jgi:hypothetical protein
MHQECLMERKQIYIAREQERGLQAIAARENTSVSAIIREAIDAYLEENLTPDIPIEEHPIWQIVGIGKSDLTEGSVSYKRDLYGDGSRLQR